MNKLILSLLLLASISPVYAKQTISFEQHIEQLKKELTSKGYDATILDKVFENNFVADKRVKKSLKNQPEVIFSFNKYVDGKLTDWRINTGRKLYKKHYAELQKIEDKYKVDPAVLIALWGVETNYGTYPLGHNAFKALSNISYSHSRQSRRDFFKKELFDLFQLVKDNNFDPMTIKSSWAGALGQCQFMPSNVLNYAVDWNKDGKTDIWNTVEDVFASSANFLSKLGWVNNTSNIHEITVPKKFNVLEKRRYTSIATWSKRGIKFKETDLNIHDKLKLFAPKNKDKKIFLVSKNLDVVKRWNNSDYFAFSVLKLADEIKKVNNK